MNMCQILYSKYESNCLQMQESFWTQCNSPSKEHKSLENFSKNPPFFFSEESDI